MTAEADSQPPQALYRLINRKSQCRVLHFGSLLLSPDLSKTTLAHFVGALSILKLKKNNG